MVCLVNFCWVCKCYFFTDPPPLGAPGGWNAEEPEVRNVEDVEDMEDVEENGVENVEHVEDPEVGNLEDMEFATQGNSGQL